MHRLAIEAYKMKANEYRELENKDFETLTTEDRLTLLERCQKLQDRHISKLRWEVYEVLK